MSKMRQIDKYLAAIFEKSEWNTSKVLPDWPNQNGVWIVWVDIKLQRWPEKKLNYRNGSQIH